MRRLGAKQIVVGENGSVEFVLWGFGCAICSDSYKGLRYAPVDFKADARRGWMPKLVNSTAVAPLWRGLDFRSSREPRGSDDHVATTLPEVGGVVRPAERMKSTRV